MLGTGREMMNTAQFLSLMDSQSDVRKDKQASESTE